MKVHDGFLEYVLEQLAGVRDVHARAMFGGIGLYASDLFFGILAADTLYFKVDDGNRAQYEAAGMSAFQPYIEKPSAKPSAGKPITFSYYQVPVGVLEDAEELAVWADASIRVARSRRKRPRAVKRR